MRTPNRLISKHARDKWKELSAAYDLSCPLDYETALAYCEQFALYMRCNSVIDAASDLSVISSKGQLMPLPETKLANSCLMAMLKIEKLLAKKLNKTTKGFDLE